MKHWTVLFFGTLTLALGGCPAVGPRPRIAVARPGPTLPLVPRWPTVAPSSADRFQDALQVYYAVDSSPERQALRVRLQSHIGRLLPAALRGGQGQRGFKLYLKLISLHRDVAARDSSRLPAADWAALVGASRQVLATFSHRGGTEEALTALAVLATVEPSSRQHHQRKFREIVHWLGELEEPLAGQIPRFVDAIEAVDKVLGRWPAPFVRQSLQVLLARQYVTLSPMLRLPDVPNQRAFKQALASLREYGWQRTRLLILAGDQVRLRSFLTKLRQGPQSKRLQWDPHLTELLGQALESRVGPAPLITLAEALAPKWPHAARRLCQQAAERFPRNAHPHFCLGSLAVAQQRTLAAIRHFSRAVRANPGYREAWERFAGVYLDRLISLLTQERLDQVRAEVKFLEAVHRAAAAWWVDRPLKASLADVYFMLGRGLYNEGRIDEAVTTLRKALRIKPTPQAYTQLGEIAFWRGRYEVAITRYNSVTDQLKGSAGWRAYWQFRTAPLVARARRRFAAKLEQDARIASDPKTRIALQRRAKTELARVTILRARTLRLGQLLLASLQDPGLQAEVLVHVGRILYRAGRRRLAIQSFNTALDRAPERSSTYVDVISFFVMRGHFDEALDAYHRALARSEISEYLKAYCTFWILDLGRRARVDPERLGLAEVFLKHLRGKQWYHTLASFLRGEHTYERLARETKSKGQRAELDFYHSMGLVRKGKLAEARRLWQKIVDSEMMAFFEYKMVRKYLREGVPDNPAK